MRPNRHARRAMAKQMSQCLGALKRLAGMGDPLALHLIMEARDILEAPVETELTLEGDQPQVPEEGSVSTSGESSSGAGDES